MHEELRDYKHQVRRESCRVVRYSNHKTIKRKTGHLQRLRAEGVRKKIEAVGLPKQARWFYLDDFNSEIVAFEKMHHCFCRNE